MAILHNFYDGQKSKTEISAKIVKHLKINVFIITIKPCWILLKKRKNTKKYQLSGNLIKVTSTRLKFKS